MRAGKESEHVLHFEGDGGATHWTAPRFQGEIKGKGPTGKFSVIQ